ncbi:MAG: hypothetical protein Q9218_002188 [Villophora microphyllina]
MMISLLAVVAASFAGHVAAQGCAAKATTQAGNPIHRPLNEVVTAGTPFVITWTNTSNGLASLELLQGPSTNVVPIACIAEGIPNNGQFVYTFPTSLTPDVTHYGLRIIDSKDHTFQYSTQFGIRNDVVHQTSSVISATASVSQASDGQVQASTVSQKSSVQTTSTHTASTQVASTQTATGSVLVTSAVANATTTALAIVATSSANSSIVVVATTHIPIPVPQSGKPYSFTVLQPSKNMTVPASLQTTQTQATVVTASASASFSSASGTGSPIASVTPGPTGGSAPSSGAGKVLAGGLLAGLGAMAAFIL